MAVSKAMLQREVRRAFNALGDLVTSGVYQKRAGAPVRDIESGTVTIPVTNYPLKQVAFVRFSEKETDKDPTLLTTMKMLFPRQDLPVKIEAEDLCVDAEGRTWEIMQMLSEPAEAVGIVQVRTAR